MAITISQEKFVELLKAQAQCASELLNSEHWLYSDDGMDYVSGACRLFANMVTNDREAFEKMLNDPEELQEYACDGICQEIYDLKPPALEQ